MISPKAISEADYNEFSLKVKAIWAPDMATKNTYVVFYADSLPAVMPTEPGDYAYEILGRGYLVEAHENRTACVTPACNTAKSAAHWFYMTSKTGHAKHAWEKACDDAFSMLSAHITGDTERPPQ